MNTQSFFSDFPAIDLGDFILREILESDAQDYLDYMNRLEMKDFLTQDNIPSSFEKAIEEVNYWRSLFIRKKSIYWAIIDKNTDKMIGTAGFNMISFANSRAEISYDLNPDYWGRGVMSTSIEAILKFSDLVLEIVRIQATVIVDNHRSIKLLERSDFDKEGLLKKYEIIEGEHKDYYMFGRINKYI